MGTDERLAMIKQIAVSFLVDSYLLFELLRLRDPDHIYNDLFECTFLVEDGEDAMQEVLDDSFTCLLYTSRCV